MLLDKSNLEKVNKYEEFVKNNGVITQDMRWARIKSNWDSDYFYIEKDDKIVAAMSVISIEDSIGKRFFYCPKGPVCDLKDIDYIKELIDEVKIFAKNNNGFLLRIDPEVRKDEYIIELYEKNGLKFIDNPKISSQPLMSLVLDINGRSEDEIFQNLSKNTRKHIRKSYREGLVTREGNREDIETFYQTTKIMADRANIGHRTLDYFYKLYDTFKDDMRLSFTEFEGEVLCCSMLIKHNDTAIALYGASNEKMRHLNQNYQINWEEIKYCIKNKISHYDMGGIFSTDEDDGLYQFKRKFTEDNVVNWIGFLDIVIDKEKYLKFTKRLNCHFDR
ncbi:MAG: peptidoglycan bridge formation glycyltransferase FemA/FemB family protein [Peptoniphilaceae bacterium]|nr:aminoacyltransferase [Peptoniphilaceae bacterium]MDD7383216.1 peptidoglycan bridge formation glycyltransferase FemA/FemB family protein [Peptoniphilaceae bacterium]MDY3738440.1 peptidoglycan bridge formation glycyltransferase FemA/FemB family protein [Peptoniphilaceae bacterium]